MVVAFFFVLALISSEVGRKRTPLRPRHICTSRVRIPRHTYVCNEEQNNRVSSCNVAIQRLLDVDQCLNCLWLCSSIVRRILHMLLAWRHWGRGGAHPNCPCRFKGQSLLQQLIEKEVPLLRATWYVKIIYLNATAESQTVSFLDLLSLLCAITLVGFDHLKKKKNRIFPP